MSAHYFDKHQSSPADETTIHVRTAGLDLEFLSANGMFSKDHLDTATKLLIENADLQGVDSLLDLGCGWGPVSCVMKKLFSDLEVTAVDSSFRAVEYAQKNARKHKLAIAIQSGNVCENLGQFDAILTNPPYSAGRDICYAFITQSFEHLNVGGSLQLVARHQKGGKMLEKKMEETFGNVKVLAKGSGFRVYCSKKLAE